MGGRLVMPVGPAYTTQHLTVVEKLAPGKTTTRAVTLVRLCPLRVHKIKKSVTVQFLRTRTWEFAARSRLKLDVAPCPVCTENPIRVYRMIESAKLAR